MTAQHAHASGSQLCDACHPAFCLEPRCMLERSSLQYSRTVGCLEDDDLLRFCSKPAPPRPAGGPSSSAIRAALSESRIKTSTRQLMLQSAGVVACAASLDALL